MNCIRKLLRQEKGGYQLTEAAIMYPFVFLLIMFVIYMGVYLLQLATVSTYAQKVALLAAREVSCPGYRDIVSTKRYATGAAELDFDLDTDTTKEGDPAYKDKVTIDNKVENVRLRAYRYWSSSPLNDDEKNYYKGIMTDLVKNNSLMRGAEGNPVEVTISCKNYVISQFVQVDVKQELMHFVVLDILGVDQPNVSTSAMASVSDTDELVRTTDFATDAIESLAKRMGIDTSSIKKTVKDCLQKLGLTY